MYNKMVKYILGRKNGIFSIREIEKNTDIEEVVSSYDSWYECEAISSCTDWHYHNYESKGVCSFDFGQDISIGDFTIVRYMKGNYTCHNDYSMPYITYGCEIRDSFGTKSVTVLKGLDIKLKIIKLLNTLSQFDCLNDFLTVKLLENKENWETLELADKICEIADVVNLYKKYKEINPALSIVRDVESLIDARIKSLIKNESNG